MNLPVWAAAMAALWAAVSLIRFIVIASYVCAVSSRSARVLLPFFPLIPRAGKTGQSVDYPFVEEKLLRLMMYQSLLNILSLIDCDYRDAGRPVLLT
jgi:hypothetical protein